MSEPGFYSIESKPIVPEVADKRLLLRQTRTQPAKLNERFALTSGVLLLRETDFVASGLAHLDRVGTVDSDYFPNPGYIPAVYVYKLNAGTLAASNALTPLPYYSISGVDGTVSTWYDAKVINDGAQDSYKLRVRITVRSIIDDSDSLYYYFVLDGAPEGLLST